ncbi:glutathione S-transferase [Acetobacter sp. TBRC 12305]|uniref:Glutathione S-transferase n=1 Tax=Acetobacter garciniae TaxID=2817435 RepID=A0A939HI53_9PROT|nr:glutathione S-transferase [Acetobacter garciniae]MBO1324830.1 glutathione S-transferase [Acetobacter garciniae]MBX0344521.1 glutathione S-transferase [Acetobacter garciniae]
MKMFLYWGSASPFVRKVMATAHELGLEDRIEIIDSAANPVLRDYRIGDFNPLCKVPAAKLDDGLCLYDSRVICEYLDTHADGNLFPAPGPSRWQALRRQALADGLLDALLLIRYENLIRPAEFRWETWTDKQAEKVNDALNAMQQDVPADTQVDIGTIAYACALGWLSFRFPDLDWTKERRGLADWHATYETRPAMVVTRPRS